MREETKQMIVLSICAIVFSLNVSGLFLALPSLCNSILEHLHPNEDKDWIIARSSTYQSIYYAITALTCIIFLPAIGRLSDLYGRKRILVMSLFSMVGAIFLALVAIHFHLLWLLIISSLFMICEGSMQVVAMAFITDISKTGEERSLNFGMMVGMSFIGITIGSVAFGWIIDHGQILSLLINLSLSALNAVFLFIAMKDLMNKEYMEERKKREGMMLNPLRVIKMLFSTSEVLTLLIISYCLFCVATADANSDYSYTQYRYGWGATLNGIQVAVFTLSNFIWQIVGMRLLIKFISEERLLVSILFLAAIVNSGYGLANKGWMFMAMSAIGGFSTVAIPLSEVLMSKQVSELDQGSLFGGVISINFVSQFFGDLLMQNVFSACLRSGGFFSCPGTAFYMGSILLFISFVICAVLFSRNPPVAKQHKYMPINTDDIGINEVI